MIKTETDVLNEINFEDIKLAPEDKIKLPSRRLLSNRPWNTEQMYIFKKRQNNVPSILKKMGIKIIGPIDYEELKKEWASLTDAKPGEDWTVQDFQDAKSGKRDYTFFNEVNGIPKPIFDEIHLRTRKRTWVDYNPNEEFWIHDYIGKPGVKFFRTWHEHNPFLSQKIRDKIEGLREIDEDLWKVYGRGMTGKIEGLVFRKWKQATDIPEGAEYIGTGMDFGFTNDPTAVVSVYKSDGNLYVKEELYRTGLTNQDIYREVDKTNKFIADSAEPKSIEELKRMGLKIEPAVKGKDSVNQSIDILKRFNIFLIGENLVKEFRAYKWKVDRKTNNPTNEPVDFMNHAIDALRYVALNKLKEKSNAKFIFRQV